MLIVSAGDSCEIQNWSPRDSSLLHVTLCRWACGFVRIEGSYCLYHTTSCKQTDLFLRNVRNDTQRHKCHLTKPPSQATEHRRSAVTTSNLAKMGQRSRNASTYVRTTRTILSVTRNDK